MRSAPLLLVVAFSSGAFAHESQPGMLELRQLAADRFAVTWRAPIYFGRPHPARLELPSHWQTIGEPTVRLLPDSQVFRRIVTIDSHSHIGIKSQFFSFTG